MKLFPFILLGLLVLPESIIYVPIFPFGKADAYPIRAPSNNDTLSYIEASVLLSKPIEVSEASVVGGRTHQNNLECDACLLLANGLNQTVLHNPKVISIVTTDLEKICEVLPASVQQ